MTITTDRAAAQDADLREQIRRASYIDGAEPVADVVTLADYTAGVRKGWDWETKFWLRVNKTPTCWLWTGAKCGEGYGTITFGGKHRLAHRLSYLMHHDSIPTDLDLDHLCHPSDGSCAGGKTCPHRPCVNPDHLKAATSRENTLRGVNQVAAFAAATACIHGHDFTSENTYVDAHGGRGCKECRRRESRDYQRRRRGASPEAYRRAALLDKIPAGLCQCGCGSPVPNATGTDGRHGLVKGAPIHYLRGHAGIRFESEVLAS